MKSNPLTLMVAAFTFFNLASNLLAADQKPASQAAAPPQVADESSLDFRTAKPPRLLISMRNWAPRRYAALRTWKV
ncbi:MAG: hypothetical protein JOY71_25010 [Acetobacteraceae bacterium]|nr:hypothetical protein [Acetobacteraceae bacterium]MBV8525342.1 hypothetical protein [Acetobacteraceae bacterium]